MKISIKNFGPIKNFEFNMEKSFIGIFGKNNAGKSYSISVVYLIIKNIIEINNDMNMNMNMNIFLNKFIKGKEEHIKKISMKSNLKKNDYTINQHLEDFLKDCFQEMFSNRLSNSFYSTFNDLDKLNNRSSKNKPQIILNSDLLEISFLISKNIVLLDKVTLNKNVILRKIKTHRKLKTGNKNLVLYTSSNDNRTLLSNFIEFSEMALFSFGKEVKNYIDNVYYLPASRSGLYQALSAFSQIFAELAKKRGFFVKKFEIPNIPEPLSDYFLNLSEINAKSKINEKKTDFSMIINEIEKEILKGEVSFDDDNKKIYYKPNGLDISLDISMASSMVSEISPIVSYLKYIIPKSIQKNSFHSNDNIKTMIFIEEPEAHLHPKIQIKLMEIFSKLIKMNVKIVITSHSNYIFHKMNNLILSKQLVPENIEILVFDESENGSIVKNAQMDELGIEDINFLDVAEELHEEKMELIDRICGE
ncbi:MAG: AAA family ATPase [Candidatus Magnetomorum sp.]|nr:AAA family ATPase [Candidatus Magnetomorum sp.]